MTTSFVLRAVALPIVMVGMLQASGCSSRPTPPPPPGGTYLSTSAGALFEQSVAIDEKTVKEEEPKNIASFTLQKAHRPHHSPETVLIGAGDAGVVRSLDGGATWQVLKTPLSFVHDVVLLANGVLVASGINGEGQGFVLRSSDEAKSWEVVLTIPFPVDTGGFQLIKPPEVPTSRVVSIELDPFNGDRVYAGTSQGSIFVGEQSAKTWRTIYQLNTANLFTTNRLGYSIRDIVASPHRSGELLLVTAARTLVRLREGKEVEISIPRNVSKPEPFTQTNKKKIFDAIYIAEFPEALFIGVDDGAVITRDDGKTWQQLPLPVDQFKSFNTISVAVSPTNTNRMLVAINSVVFRSEDGGNSWNSFSLNLLNHGITSLLIDPSNASRVLAVTTPLST